MWWEIKQNLPYMKEIGVENVKHFQDIFLLFKIQVMKSRDHCWIHMTKESKKIKSNSHICPVKYVDDLSFLDTPWLSGSRGRIDKKF